MMDAIVQFYRNALCCIKNLEWFQDSLPFLWDANVTLRYYDLPEPLDQTTPLEVLISLGQLYAVVSLSMAGWTLFTTSLGKLLRIQRFMDQRKNNKTNSSSSDGNSSSADNTDRLINASLVKEGMFAIRSMFIGFILFFLGLSFFWLFANSWHVTETPWIGGLQGLIHALTVMEIGLLPLLYYMWKDAKEQLAKAKRMETMAKQLQEGTLTRDELGLSSLETLTGWVPFWDSGVSLLSGSKPDAVQEEKDMAKEKTKVESSLDELFGEKKGGLKKDDGEKETKIRKELWQKKADELNSAAFVTRVEGYREFVYFLLNCVAFYGYLLCVIVFYYPNSFQEGGDDDSSQGDNSPLWIRRLLFHMEPGLADWRGNMAGDFMWTVEPVIVLASPLYLSWAKPKSKSAPAAAAAAAKKTKAD